MKDALTVFVIMGGTIFGMHCINRYVDEKVDEGVRREREAFDALHKKEIDDAYHRGYTEGYNAGRTPVGTGYNR